jgi:hypothetical protein
MKAVLIGPATAQMPLPTRWANLGQWATHLCQLSGQHAMQGAAIKHHDQTTSEHRLQPLGAPFCALQCPLQTAKDQANISLLRMRCLGQSHGMDPFFLLRLSAA